MPNIILYHSLPQVDHSWQIWKYNTRVNPEVGEVLVPASCCITDTACVLDNKTVVGNIWPDDCYHKESGGTVDD